MARLALDLMDPRRSQSDAVARTLDTASARMLYHTMTVFEYAADSAETYIRIGRHLVKRGNDPSLAADPALPRRSLGFGLAFRGHMAEALRVLGTDRLYLVSQIAVLGAMPRDQRERRCSTAASLPSPRRRRSWSSPCRGGPGSGDTTALSRAIALGDHGSGAGPEARFLAEAARAWRTLALGDSAAALSQFLQLTDFPNDYGIGDWERYMVIRLLNDARRFHEALTRLDRRGPEHAVSLGRRAAAGTGSRHGGARAGRGGGGSVHPGRRSVGHGDPALQPIVSAARAAALRLRRAGGR